MRKLARRPAGGGPARHQPRAPARDRNLPVPVRPWPPGQAGGGRQGLAPTGGEDNRTLMAHVGPRWSGGSAIYAGAQCRGLTHSLRPSLKGTYELRVETEEAQAQAARNEHRPRPCECPPKRVHPASSTAGACQRATRPVVAQAKRCTQTRRTGAPRSLVPGSPPTSTKGAAERGVPYVGCGSSVRDGRIAPPPRRVLTRTSTQLCLVRAVSLGLSKGKHRPPPLRRCSGSGSPPCKLAAGAQPVLPDAGSVTPSVVSRTRHIVTRVTFPRITP